MADTNIPAPTVIEAAPAVTPTITAPQTPVEAPPAAPVVAPVVEAAKVETAPAEPAKPVEPAKPAETPTVLTEAIDKSKEPPKTEQPKEPPKTEEPAKVESKEGDQSVEPAPPPSYDAFTLPEGVSLDETRVKQFTELLGDLETKSKADHALFQEFGQKAVDFHLNELRTAVEQITKIYQDTWEKTKTSWKDDFLKDPEIGGNRFQTTVDQALNVIRTYGGTADQQKEFRDLMESSGIGNHKAVIRLLRNIGAAMAEGKPLAAVKPIAEPKSKLNTLYGKQA